MFGGSHNRSLRLSASAVLQDQIVFIYRVFIKSIRNNHIPSKFPYALQNRFAVGWNVGERKPHKAVGDCGFLNPEPPNRRRSSYVC